MKRDERFRDDDGKLDLGKIKWYEDSSYKIVLLERYIDEQQDTIGEQKIAIDELISDYKKLEKENEKLRQKLEEQEKLCNLRVESIRGIYDE